MVVDEVVMVGKAKSAMGDTKSKLDEVLVEDPLTQQSLAMKEEQARLKKDTQDLRQKVKNADHPG